MIRLTTRYAIPLLLGVAWIWIAIKWHWQVECDAIDLHRTDGGTATLKAFTFNPPMIVWWLTRLPEGRWHVAPLYAYFALLTLVLWNAPRSSRHRNAATLAYFLHLAATLSAIVIAGTLSLPRELVGSFNLTRDLMLLMEITRSFPGTVYTAAVILLVWHSLAIGCLTISWRRTMKFSQHQPLIVSASAPSQSAAHFLMGPRRHPADLRV